MTVNIIESQKAAIRNLTDDKIRLEQGLQEKADKIDFMDRQYKGLTVKRRKLIDEKAKLIDRQSNLKGKTTELTGAIKNRELEINQLKHGIDLDETIKVNEVKLSRFFMVTQTIGIIAIIAFQLM